VYSRFAAESFGTGDPAVFAADRLVRAGSPVLPRAPFVQYPPYLQQHAVIGRELLHVAESEGFVVDEILQNLARTLAPKAMSANLALLEIIQRDAVPIPFEGQLRIAVVMHVSDVTGASEVLARLQALPAGYRLIITTSNGVTARRMTEIVGAIEAPRYGAFEVRVTPSNKGRDMSDMFIACRDVLLDGSCDIVVKVHARPRKRKTMIMDRYFRRYQLENLLDSEGHVSGILRMFEREPGLGLVFPPMMHIGYQITGRGWVKYRAAAVALTRRLGIAVPLDTVSPNAPFGGMWFARPEALALLARWTWSYRDYNSSRAVDLGRLQERLVTAAAGELGFHARTVLTAEHAEISHTALEFKVDQMFSTTTGYPVDQITLLQRAGHTGRGGFVGLSRMYLRLNHPHLSRVVLPVMALAERVWYLGSHITAIGRAGERALTSRRSER
jgi:rhamnosyltransferase